jgi:hypothetical protein
MVEHGSVVATPDAGARRAVFAGVRVGHYTSRTETF